MAVVIPWYHKLYFSLFLDDFIASKVATDWKNQGDFCYGILLNDLGKFKFQYITKTRLFKYTEKITTKK